MALAASPVLLSLAPLLVGRARRGVVGSSRYAKTLRESVRQAAADGQQRAVFILGEPGLEKDNIAALIHFGSPQRKELMLRLDAAPRAGLRAAQYELCDTGRYYRDDIRNGYMNRKQAIEEAAMYAVDLQAENGWGI